MAEAHPVGFQWVMEAKARGAKIIHIDPRFSRTSAMADMFVPVRAGADIAFVGGLVNYVLTHEKYFHEYVLNYTNASVILSEDFADTEDLDGVFSGLNREQRCYNPFAWRYEGFEPGAASGARGVEWDDECRIHEAARGESHGSGGAAASHTPQTDETLQHPRCVFQVLKRHFARYTPEMVARIAGVPEDVFRTSLRADHRELRPRQDHGVRLQRGLDAAHGRRPVHPHGVDPAGAARQHGPAGRRDPRAARARVHPGIHRHPDAVRPAARATCPCRSPPPAPTWTATCRPRPW